MNMKKFAALALAGAMTLSLAACGSTTTTSSAASGSTGSSSAAGSSAAASSDAYANLDPVVLKGADASGVGSAAQKFGELVADKLDSITGGKLTVDYYPNSELGGDMDIQQMMLDGQLDYVVMQTAPAVSFVPSVAVFDLPMVFAKYDGDTIDKVLNSGDFYDQLSKDYTAKNYKLMGFLQNATYRLTTSNKKLDTLDAFKGLRIRTMENSNHMAFWTALGAAPTPLAWPEVYISLQNGTIEAQENAADTCLSANFQEVQKYLNCTNHILYLNQLVMNNEKFNSLDPAYQAALTQAVTEAIAELRPTLADLDKNSKDALVKGGMELVEYPDSFYDQVLALDGVKQLYQKIDTDVNGLGTTLQNALAAAAG